MTDVDPLLAEAFDDLGRQAPHDPDLAGSVRRRARRQAAVAGSVLAVARRRRVSTVVAVGRPDGPAVERRSRAADHERPPARDRPLPGPGDRRAARVGVDRLLRPARRAVSRSSAAPRATSSPSSSDRSPRRPLPDRSNKILWVPNPSPSGPTTPPPDVPRGHRGAPGGHGPARRRKELLALGPSIVDLPQPGCWHFDVSWGQYTDSLSLRYVPG